jgi:hypothetical protein
LYVDIVGTQSQFRPYVVLSLRLVWLLEFGNDC